MVVSLHLGAKRRWYGDSWANEPNQLDESITVRHGWLYGDVGDDQTMQEKQRAHLMDTTEH